MASADDISLDEARALVRQLATVHQSFEIYPGIRLQGAYDPQFMWDLLQLEPDLSGKRALEIGPAEGFFSKRLRDAGAEVTVMDYRSKQDSGFWLMERLSGHSFTYVHASVLDRTAFASLGRFDIVLFLGVLYHLPDLLRAIDNLREVSRGRLFVETLCSTELPADIPAAQYFHGNSKVGDWTNFWAPNQACLNHMLRDSGFRVTREAAWGDRALAVCEVVEGPYARFKLDIAYPERRRAELPPA